MRSEGNDAGFSANERNNLRSSRFVAEANIIKILSKSNDTGLLRTNVPI